jgi:transcription regulator MmyB-like protein
VELTHETLRTADDPDQALITYAAEPGSPSHDALQLLLTWAAHAPSAMPDDDRALTFRAVRADGVRGVASAG